MIVFGLLRSQLLWRNRLLLLILLVRTRTLIPVSIMKTPLPLTSLPQSLFYFNSQLNRRYGFYYYFEIIIIVIVIINIPSNFFIFLSYIERHPVFLHNRSLHVILIFMNIFPIMLHSLICFSHGFECKTVSKQNSLFKGCYLLIFIWILIKRQLIVVVPITMISFTFTYPFGVCPYAFLLKGFLSWKHRLALKSLPLQSAKELQMWKLFTILKYLCYCSNCRCF